MLNNFTIVGVALFYLGILFVVASYADTQLRRQRMAAGQHSFIRPLVYTLSFGVYCTSWTFFGSVGLAAHSGLDFLPIYIGPILMFIVGWPVVRRVVELSKQHNITSIADFIAARYGKSQALGATVAVIAVDRNPALHFPAAQSHHLLAGSHAVGFGPAASRSPPWCRW